MKKSGMLFSSQFQKEKVFEVDIKGILDKFMQEGNALKFQIKKSEYYRF